MADNLAHHYNQLGRVLTIDDLPDDILLKIFNLYVVRYQDLGFTRFRSFSVSSAKRKIESWQSLVHVCRRWRCLVFGSPRHLNLRICYTPSLSARKTLDVWPALPILIEGNVCETLVDGVIAGLKHSDRICGISLDCYPTTLETEKLWTAMQVPFPELEFLRMEYPDSPWPFAAIPDSFLGGSAPRLRYFVLSSIPFPGLLKLLASATHLIELHLDDISHSGYISPEAMATCLSMLISIETLRLRFNSPYPDLKSRRSFPPTRSVLPTLTNFWFDGPNEYLEEFVARIDAPQLSSTTFFDHIDFDTPGLRQFISRAPTLGTYDEARLVFDTKKSLVRLRQSPSHPERSDRRIVQVRILGLVPDRQLSSLAQICTFSLRPLLTMENLYIYEVPYSIPYRIDQIESNNWPNLLLPFTAVKNLYISKLISPHIALALQEFIGGRTTEVFPALQNVLLQGFQSSEPVQEGIAQFISARQLANHPVAISSWDSVGPDVGGR